MSTTTFSIGLDLDGTCGDFHSLFRNTLIKHGLIQPQQMPVKTPSEYSYTKAGCFDTTEEFLRLLDEATAFGMYKHMKPYEGVSEALWRLKERGAYIKVLTARHALAETDTRYWLNKVGIPFDELHLTHDKTSVMADVYIDDYAHHIEALRGLGRKAIIFTQPYNLHLNGARMSHWSQAEKLVTK